MEKRRLIVKIVFMTFLVSFMGVSMALANCPASNPNCDWRKWINPFDDVCYTFSVWPPSSTPAYPGICGTYSVPMGPK